MAIAISNINLNEIYSLSTDDKLDLVDLIIKSIRSATTFVRPNTKETTWVDEFDGKWEDSKSADEMVADLRAARTVNSDVIL